VKGFKKAEEYFKEKREKDPEYRKVWEEIEPEYQLANQIIERRKKLNLTQKDLAGLMNTSQSVVSRLENGRDISLKTIKRAARVLMCKPIFLLEPREEEKTLKK